MALAAIVAGAGYVWWDNSSHYKSTDDAFIAARQIAIAPQVTGYVTSVPVTDNQHVEAGAVIARLDDRDYQAALDQADAQMTAAKAGVANVQAEIDVQTAQIQSSKAQVQSGRGRARLRPATGRPLQRSRQARRRDRRERAAI